MNKVKNLNLLGIDFGSKVVGLALFSVGRDPFPTPFGKIINISEEQVLADLKAIIEDEVVEGIVLGIPHLLDGQSTKMTEKVEKFGDKLKSAFPTIEIFLQDETLSTFEAEDRMKNDPRYNFKVNPKEIDALSASIILEDFVQENRP